jgi:hypothetical protein
LLQKALSETIVTILKEERFIFNNPSTYIVRGKEAAGMRHELGAGAGAVASDQQRPIVVVLLPPPLGRSRFRPLPDSLGRLEALSGMITTWQKGTSLFMNRLRGESAMVHS